MRAIPAMTTENTDEATIFFPKTADDVTILEKMTIIKKGTNVNVRYDVNMSIPVN